MLTQDLLTALKTYTANMKNDVTIVVQQENIQVGTHEKRNEFLEFINNFVSVSDRLHVDVRDVGDVLRSPLSFYLEVDGKNSGISFSGIPGGHEFNSLVLVVLQVSGSPIKLDENITRMISSVDQTLKFEVFVSLSCHNCPDVVQALNQFAILNPRISNEMIDGGLYPELIEKRGIQGVPTVFLNGEVFANGKVDTAQLLEKLVAKYPNMKDVGGEERLPVQDVTVIGGGPAGVAAAIYSARKGLKVTLVADRIGGQVKDTMGIENLISVPKTTGPQLSNNLLAHLQQYDITRREHLKVDRLETGKVKKIYLSNNEVIESKTVIIATGAKWRELGVPGEKENIGNGVAYCPHCDGPFFKGKDVAVIGGGNSGIEAALDLAGIVKAVTVFEFLPELKADQILVQQAEKTPNISILKNVATKEIIADNGKVCAIEYQDRETSQSHRKELDGVFVQIGLVPNSAFLQGAVETTRYGEILINERCETTEPGIFACGDVTTVPYKQIVIAMGEGSKAALSAFDYLLKRDC